MTSYNTTPLPHFNTTAYPVDSSLQRQYNEIVTKQYFNVALAALLVYNTIITMDSEVKYFWPKPWNPISLVYFANRYIRLLGGTFIVVLNEFAENILRSVNLLRRLWLVSTNLLYVPGLFARWTSALAAWVIVILIDYILVIRVLALYEQNRRMSLCLKLLFCLEAAADLVMLIYGYWFEGAIVEALANSETICAYKRHPPQVIGIISWCIPMVFGLLLLSLALYKASQYWRLAGGFKGFNLVKILVLDQVLFYSTVIFCSVLKIMYNRIFHHDRFASELLNAAGSPTFLCILGGYLLVHLKEATEMGFNEGTNYRLGSMSAMEFL